MKQEALVASIANVLEADASDAARKNFAQQIMDGKFLLQDLHPMLFLEGKAPMRFSWMLGYLAEQQAVLVFPCLAFYFKQRHNFKILNFNRSLAKLFSLAGIPEEIEGEVVSALFDWIQDKQSDVTIKTHSMMAIFKHSEGYPALRQELTLLIEEGWDQHPVSFKQTGRKILKTIDPKHQLLRKADEEYLAGSRMR
jgi:hypothetical protein